MIRAKLKEILFQFVIGFTLIHVWTVLATILTDLLSPFLIFLFEGGLSLAADNLDIKLFRFCHGY